MVKLFMTIRVSEWSREYHYEKFISGREGLYR